MNEVGNIAEIDFDRMYVRVVFPQYDNLLSGWMPVVVPTALNRKSTFYPAMDAQVLCAMESDFQFGYVIGEIYSKDVIPEITGEGMSGTAYGDGTVFKYDEGAHTATIEGNNLVVNVTAGKKVTVNSQDDVDIISAKKVSIDSQTSTIITTGTSKITVSPTGIKIERGGESLGVVLQDIMTQLTLETHGTAVGPTTPPLNIAAYTAILGRIITFLQ